MPHHVSRKLLIGVCWAALGAAAHASTLTAFDTLGPSNTFLSGLGLSIGGGSAAGPTGANLVSASRFTAQVDGVLDSASLIVWRQQGSAAIALRLLADDAGQPGAALASANAVVPDAPQLVTASFSGGVQITAGQSYWFGASTTDLAAAHFWNVNGSGVRGLTAFTGALWQGPGDWFVNQDQLLGAFRVNVTSPVSEPAAALLLALGAVSLGLRRKAHGIA